ncbi:MAG: hypothetical protein WCO52_01635 [bacterium]
MKQAYEDLIAHIQTLEAGKDDLEGQNRALAHRLQLEQRQVSLLEHQARTVRQLVKDLVSQRDPGSVLSHVCTILVHELGWDTSFVVVGEADVIKVAASYQATTSQLGNVRKHLGQAHPYLNSLSAGHSFTTLDSSEKDALLLRSVFCTDEVVLVPLACSGKTYGTIAVCAHTHPRHEGVHRDVRFLSEVADIIACSLFVSER